VTELLLKDEAYAIMGACFEVYREHGCGFLESVYQESLALELEMRGIPFVAQQPCTIQYKGHTLRPVYIPDFCCYGSILVEIKALSQLAGEHHAQVINYLKATRMRLALLVNFGHHPQLEWHRIIL